MGRTIVSRGKKGRAKSVPLSPYIYIAISLVHNLYEAERGRALRFSRMATSHEQWISFVLATGPHTLVMPRTFGFYRLCFPRALVRTIARGITTFRRGHDCSSLKGQRKAYKCIYMPSPGNPLVCCSDSSSTLRKASFPTFPLPKFYLYHATETRWHYLS